MFKDLVNAIALAIVFGICGTGFLNAEDQVAANPDAPETIQAQRQINDSKSNNIIGGEDDDDDDEKISSYQEHKMLGADEEDDNDND